MFAAFLLLFIITCGGFAVTYGFDRKFEFLSGLAAGAVIGQVIFSLVAFVLCSIAGASVQTVVLSLALTISPLLLFVSKKYRTFLYKDLKAFRQSIVQTVFSLDPNQFVLAVIYAALLLFLWFFFERAMLDIKGGIGTGSLHNYGDLSFHLQAIYGFLSGENFPPQNPSFANTKFTYPFMADLVTALLAKVNADIGSAMFCQNLFLIVALIVLMRHFTFELTGSRVAAEIAPFILLFSGGLGFVLFFRDAFTSGKGVFEYLSAAPLDYTIRPDSTWRWGNTLTTIFMTQRSFLLGMPLALVVLTKIFQIFSSRENSRAENVLDTNNDQSDDQQSISAVSCAIIGFLAGTLPLVHAHSFAVLMGVTAILALMSLRRWREWAIFFAAASIIALPELLWAVTGSATKAESFVDWQFGWDRKDANPIWFWFKNTGFFIPLLIAAVILLIVNSKKRKAGSEEKQANLLLTAHRSPLILLLFWLPFVLCFVIPNMLRLAPWIWDNIKVLIYWFVVSIPLVAWLLARIWQRGKPGKVLTLILLVGLTLAGLIDVWRVAAGRNSYTVFDSSAVKMAAQIREKTEPASLIASAPAHNSPVALSGRRWFLGYTGHVWSHGIDPNERETILKIIYSGDEEISERMIRENNIDYLVVGPLEEEFTFVNSEFLERFPVIAQSGNHRLLKVR